jgi:uncharacterized protein YbbC (DUF1343 family)
MRPLFFLLVLILPSSPVFSADPVVRTGIEVLRDREFDILQGKRVGLITNPTGVDARLLSTVDILAEAPGVRLVALFGPEHGVRGEYGAGDHIPIRPDTRTGLPVFSLYGPTRKPTPEMLREVDVLVYDVQDVGCRSYTYISTMGYAMEAAADRGIPFVVLDRPNPLGGTRVEGCPVEEPFRSFVSRYPIPYVYGLTCGELATFLNGEGLLEDARRCSLTVVPMVGWRRTMTFDSTGLPWVPTSPHVPHATTPPFLVATGILGELQVVSPGVGYTIPFETLAAEWIDAPRLADRMNAAGFPGVMFRPITFQAMYGTFEGRRLHGVQLYLLDPLHTPLMPLQFLFLQVHNSLYPDHNPLLIADSSRLLMFDRVLGTDRVRKAMSRTMSLGAILPILNEGVAEFSTRTARYRLYR